MHKILLLTLLTFSMLYPTPVRADSKGSVIGTDDDGYSAYRMIVSTGDQQINRSSVVTRDADNYAAYRVVTGAGSTPIPTSTDLEINSLDVLLYVKSATIQPHTSDSAVVIKPETGSTTDTVLEIQSEDGTAITTFGSDGSLEVDTVKASTGYYGDTTADPAEFPQGLETANGAGFSIGGDAPTTNALELSECDDAATILAPTGKAYIAQLGGEFYFRNDMRYARLYIDDLFADDVLCTDVMTNNIRNRLENGPPIANFGIIYPEQTAPSAPASGWTVYTGTTTGFLSAKYSDNTTDIIATPNGIFCSAYFQNIPSPATITLTTGDTPYNVQLSSVDAESGAGDCLFNNAGDYIEIFHDGNYEIDVSLSYTGTLNTTYYGKIYVNSTAVEGGFVRSIGTGTDIGHVAFSKIINCSAGDKIYFKVFATADTKEIQEYSANMSVNRL